MNLETFKPAANEKLRERFGIDLNDAGIDDADLLSAIEAGMTPAAFVAWWGVKYDLTPIR